MKKKPVRVSEAPACFMEALHHVGHLLSAFQQQVVAKPAELLHEQLTFDFGLEVADLEVLTCALDSCAGSVVQERAGRADRTLEGRTARAFASTTEYLFSEAGHEDEWDHVIIHAYLDRDDDHVVSICLEERERGPFTSITGVRTTAWASA